MTETKQVQKYLILTVLQNGWQPTNNLYSIHAPWKLGVLHNSYHQNYYFKISAYLRFSPPSATGCSSASGNPFTKAFRCACSRASHISASEWRSNGSKLTRNVPEKRTGSWGIIVNRDLLQQNYLIKTVVTSFCKLALSQHFMQGSSKNQCYLMATDNFFMNIWKNSYSIFATVNS